MYLSVIFHLFCAISATIVVTSILTTFFIPFESEKCCGLNRSYNMCFSCNLTFILKSKRKFKFILVVFVISYYTVEYRNTNSSSNMLGQLKKRACYNLELFKEPKIEKALKLANAQSCSNIFKWLLKILTTCLDEYPHTLF
ncbi:hypothetical protein BpHYR1_043683 [Brachionus plicatilis]|uniref:Uncharacterized protein n=1 Tax=Brachionus plicatilis TaxID=10195 RepID=A0A3M7RQH5_BRAPC|nr:hypothetical protein BpHYR1_043683 [Brachionus plicatilis]